MKPTIESILQNHLNTIQAEVTMSAYTESFPGWMEKNAKPDFFVFAIRLKVRLGSIFKIIDISCSRERSIFYLLVRCNRSVQKAMSLFAAIGATFVWSLVIFIL